MRRLIAALLVSSCLASGAGAATLAGVTLQDTYPVEGQTLKLNGIGLRTLTIFNVKVYVAALYLAAPSHDAQQILKSATPKVIRLQFLHSGSKADVEKEYRLGETNNCGAGGCSKADEGDFERLVAAAPGVNVGDTSTYIFTAKGVTVLANDKPIAVINNPDLAYHLLEGFIGAHPPSEDLKAHLLGQATD
jgi:hypothetical protein